MNDLVKRLSDYDTLRKVYHISGAELSYPSSAALREIVDITRSIIFPGYFGSPSFDLQTLSYHIGVNIEKLRCLLNKQIFAALSFDFCEGEKPCDDLLKDKSNAIAEAFIDRLPTMRETLVTDVEAAYLGDPAAKSYAEIILCYPAIKAISNYRIAHELLVLGVPLIPRMIGEMAHSETGIDIHPGATIGKYFTIDHGTGVVIGETTIIGDHVKLYQGVTLGAKSFPLDENGNPIKNLPRHPIIEDNVVIYSNATVLGRITVGENAVIGGNIWVTNDVEKGAKIVQYKRN